MPHIIFGKRGKIREGESFLWHGMNCLQIGWLQIDYYQPGKIISRWVIAAIIFLLGIKFIGG